MNDAPQSSVSEPEGRPGGRPGGFNDAGRRQQDERRRRRRTRRAAAVSLFLLIALSLAWFFESQATTTVIFVRYAEPAPGENPELAEAGWQRAGELVRVLADVDVVAGVNAIFATRYRPTQDTAEPLARQLGLPVQVVDAGDTEGLVKRILTDHKGEIALVVTNEIALPVLIRKLQGSKRVPPMEAGEHDNLYIVSIPWYGKVKTLRLRYGEPWLPTDGS